MNPFGNAPTAHPIDSRLHSAATLTQQRLLAAVPHYNDMKGYHRKKHSVAALNMAALYAAQLQQVDTARTTPDEVCVRMQQTLHACRAIVGTLRPPAAVADTLDEIDEMWKRGREFFAAQETPAAPAATPQNLFS